MSELNNDPAAPPTGPQRTPVTANDEVSLRDLAKVIFRGLPLILGLALLLGLFTYLRSDRAPVTYQANTTVLVTPPPLQVPSTGTEELQGLVLTPVSEVTLQTYETMARSQSVLQAVVKALPELNLTPGQVSSMGTLRQLGAMSKTSAAVPMTILHQVKAQVPRRAALVADAWAAATIDAVRTSLSSSLAPMTATTTREMARLQKDIQESERRIQKFAAKDNSMVLQAKFDSLTQRLMDAQLREDQLTQDIAASEARIQALESSLPTGATHASPQPLDLVALPQLLGRGAGLAQPPQLRFATAPSAQHLATAKVVQAVSDALDALPESETKRLAADKEALQALATVLYQSVVTNASGAWQKQVNAFAAQLQQQQEEALQLALYGYAFNQAAQNDGAAPPTGTTAALAQAELQRERVNLAGLKAERESLRRMLASYDPQAATLQERLAVVEQKKAGLERELSSAQNAYDTMAQMRSSISYITELAPTNARILSRASEPAAPVGSNRALNTLLAALIGGFVGTALVLLRAALRKPRTASA